MRPRLASFAAFAVAVGLVLTGCATPSPESSPSESTRPTPSITPEPTETPADGASSITVDVEGLTIGYPDHDVAITFHESGELIELFNSLTDETATGTGPNEYGITIYDWDGIRLSAWDDGHFFMRISTDTIGDVPIETRSGIAVGSVRSDVLAADPSARPWVDQLAIDAREVPGTNSLNRPGEIGQEFLALAFDGDVVTAIRVPADDFSDL